MVFAEPPKCRPMPLYFASPKAAHFFSCYNIMHSRSLHLFKGDWTGTDADGV